MKNSKENAIVSKRAIASLLLVSGVFLLVGFACSKGGGESKPIPPAYIGSWTGNDGSTITIRSDGSGDYKSGTTSVSGGTVEIDEGAKSLKISFVGIGPGLTIDKAPSGDAVEMNDFTDFYNHASANFKASYTKAEIARTFKTFVDQREKVQPSLNAVQAEAPTFSSPPSIRTEKGIKVLTANGEFATSPSVVKFETDYEWDGGAWKVVKFKVKL